MKYCIVSLIMILCVTTFARADETCGVGASLAPTSDIASYSIIYPFAGECFAGYDAIDIQTEILIPISNVPNTRCGIGYYPTPTGCVAYGRDNCPERYYAVAPTNAFVRMTDDTCPTNYAEYNDTELCKSWLEYIDKPEMCTPQLLCNSGGVALRTSTGINLPIYRERATTTTLNFGFENGGVCYMNMIPGAGANTINIKYNNEIYHGAE